MRYFLIKGKNFIQLSLNLGKLEYALECVQRLPPTFPKTAVAVERFKRHWS